MSLFYTDSDGEEREQYYKSGWNFIECMKVYKE